MMHKLLIADDEITIREGLCDVVNWSKYGFELAGVLEDGKDVIRILKKEPIDLIITDIKMIHTTGLDIAKYISENHLPTKIILISGYSEVDLAMTAIKYHVTDYIMKPIDLDLLLESVEKIKAELDQNQNSLKRRARLEYYEKNIDSLKEAFFEELLISSIKNHDFVKSSFQLIYPELDFDSCCCFTLNLHVKNYEQLIHSTWDHTTNDFYNLLNNYLNIASEDIEYKLISKKKDALFLIGFIISKDLPEVLSYENYILRRLAKLRSDIRDFFSVSVSVETLKIYKNIPELLLESAPSLKQSDDIDALLTQIEDIQIMIYSSLSSCDKASCVTAVNKLISCIQNLDISTTRKLIMNLVQTIHSNLLKNYPDTAFLDIPETAISDIAAAASASAVESRLSRYFDDVIDQINYQSTDIVTQAKQYIQEHITEDISLEDIADNFYLSQYYFSRLFKEKAGENLINDIVRVKMEKAMALLKNPKYKVYEICALVGYKSNQYFVKVFKNYTGLTPSAYRSAKLNINTKEEESE